MSHEDRAQAIYDRLHTIPVPMAIQQPSVLTDDGHTESLVPVYSRTALYPAGDHWSLFFHLGDDWSIVIVNADILHPRPPRLSPSAIREIATIDAALDGLVVHGIRSYSDNEQVIIDAINAAHQEAQ